MVNFLFDGPTHSNLLWCDKKKGTSGQGRPELTQVNNIRLPSGSSMNLRSLNKLLLR